MADSNEPSKIKTKEKSKSKSAMVPSPKNLSPLQEMDTDSFELIYRGPNLDSGSMNARALGEVLSGFSRAFSVVAHDNDLGDRFELRVKDVDPGSFHILFEAVEYVKNNPVASAVLIQAANTSWTVAKDTTSGVYTVVTDIVRMIDAKRKLRGSSANQAAASFSEAGVSIQTPNENITLTKTQYELLLSRRIEKPLAQIVSPLAFGSVTSFEVARERGKPLVRVDYQERDYFDYQEVTERQVKEGSDLIGRLNSLSKTNFRGTFHTADGIHVAYKYV